MTTSHENIPAIERYDYWNDDWGDIVSEFIDPIDVGEEVDATLFPAKCFLNEPASVIPALFSSEYWICNEVIKDTIEKLEPGRHRFRGFCLDDRRNGGEVAKLYIINILDPLDAVDVEMSDSLDLLMKPDGSRVFSCEPFNLSEEREEIKLFEDRIQGRHLWIGPGAYGPGRAFVSDELHDIIKENDISPSPLRFYRTKRTLH